MQHLPIRGGYGFDKLVFLIVNLVKAVRDESTGGMGPDKLTFPESSISLNLVRADTAAGMEPDNLFLCKRST